MGSRRQRRQRQRNMLWIIGAFCGFVVIAVIRMCFSIFAGDAVPVSVPSYQSDEGAISQMPGWRYVLSLGIPGFAQATERQVPVKVEPELSLRTIMVGTVDRLTGVDIRDLSSVFRAEIPILAAFKQNQPAVSALSLPDFPKFMWKGNVPSGKPLVGIYHTHTSEAYVPWSGVDHARGGKCGDIVDAGEALVKRLAEHDIAAMQSKTVHDYPRFMKAYGPSEETAKKMLAENPSLQMLFDIHRDAGKKEDTTVMVNGLSTARISIIVAIGQEGLPQPHWQQNHAFAKLIDAKLNQHYPGLSRGIQLVDWRFNQHLFPRSLLLEVGCQENSKEEVLRSMEFLGDVLAEILAES